MMTRRQAAFACAVELTSFAAEKKTASPERVRIGRVPEGGLQPQVAIDDRGTLHLVYYTGDPHQGNLFYVNSTDGPLSASRSGRISLMCSATYWLSRPQKSTFFAPNAPFGKRPRSSTQSSIRARCRLGSHGTTTTLPVCIGTSTEYGQLAMKDFGLLASVVEHKNAFFREAAARYDLAKPGSLRVCPSDANVAQIRTDYRDMREMFFAEAPPFDTVMADLRELEGRVNR